eukprot:GHVT01069123.1.p1 GENE.GHVT01069123.1~~GHVT01069123.1.p1  ORF type:complete len:419 (+),score=85.08 GHVT01069123.1:241-1497(+)
MPPLEGKTPTMPLAGTDKPETPADGTLQETKKDAPPDEVLVPDFTIADMRYQMLLPPELAHDTEKLKKKLMDHIEKDAMTPFYISLCEVTGLPQDEELLARLRLRNVEEEKRLQAKIEDARENYGDSEVRDALLAMAHFKCMIGHTEEATSAYEVAFNKTVGAGGRLDIILTLVRLGLFHNDAELVKTSIVRAKEVLEKGGDWERRNKLKVYEAVHLMRCRSFKSAVELLVSATATYTATELISFDSLIFYVVVLSMLSLERPEVKAKVVTSAEVLQVATGDADLLGFLTSLAECQYTNFFKFLGPIALRVQRDRHLGKHYRFWIRNIRLRAYAQFLEPYKSVTLESMAAAFGVSVQFIENEVSSFMASSKLNCKIDTVRGVIEADRPDARNHLYSQSVKQGDMLLNRIQRLSRIIDL